MTKPTYEKVWHLTVGKLKTYPIFVLKCMEKDIKAENTRVSLALRWIRKIRRVLRKRGGKNG